MDTSGLTDAYLHRHGTRTTYRTWEMRTSQDNPTWTSPDHILISSHNQGNITAAQVDDTTLEHGMDHSVVTATIHIQQNKTIRKTLHVKLKCKKKDTDKYNELVASLLPSHGPTGNTEVDIGTIHSAIVTACTTIRPTRLHKSKGIKGIRLQADVRALGTIARALKQHQEAPAHLCALPVYTSIPDPTPPAIRTKLKLLQKQLNRKAEKRTHTRTRM